MEGTVVLKTMSVTDDVIDWFLPNKILGCATAVSKTNTLVRLLHGKRDCQSRPGKA